MPTSFTQKIRKLLCCEPADVDQNEGPPPPPSTVAPQAAITAAATDQSQQQPAAETSAEYDGEEQPAPIEEDWGDEEPEPSPYKPEDFVVEEGEYSRYKYDPSPFKGFDDVQKAFEKESQAYDKNKPAPVDINTIWENREYERPIRNWNMEQEFNATPSRAQAAAR
ncbi:hypothetical protein MUCCIDRAFT_82671 [Mucor lusitanicus CBS 277.49]|uniref:Uncharacterized protein n=1 Tax=Mucor lusitanicus CBS 277.49 TaxID=747725 RepID=A0A168KDV5_MUCCL|nr:hypothetical protein MUCCIDRAFT_82671 [Mucor lusitanicus CBS 277.49]